MSKGKKIAVITALILVGLGVLITALTLFSMNFDFRKLSTVKTEKTSFTIEEEFRSIEINCADSDVRFKKSDDGSCRVECVQEEKIIHTAEVKNGVLTISQTDKRKTSDHFVIMFNFEETGVTVYLPEEEYENLYVKTLSGDIIVPESFTFTDTEMSSASGDITCQAKASGSITVKSKSGDVTVMNSSAEDILAKSSSGDVMIYSADAKNKLTAEALSGDVGMRDADANKLSASSTSGDIELFRINAAEFDAVTTSGDVEFSGCDADDIRMKSTSGDITGSLLSEKQFSVHTVSGFAKVPESSGTGKCDATTTSGDIHIVISE